MDRRALLPPRSPPRRRIQSPDESRDPVAFDVEHVNPVALEGHAAGPQARALPADHRDVARPFEELARLELVDVVGLGEHAGHGDHPFALSLSKGLLARHTATTRVHPKRWFGAVRIKSKPRCFAHRSNTSHSARHRHVLSTTFPGRVSHDPMIERQAHAPEDRHPQSPTPGPPHPTPTGQAPGGPGKTPPTSMRTAPSGPLADLPKKKARTAHPASTAFSSDGAAEREVEAWMKQSIEHEKVGAIVLKAWQDKSPQLLLSDADGIKDLPPLPPHLKELRLFRCRDLTELPDLSALQTLETLVIDHVGLKRPPRFVAAGNCAIYR